MKINDVELAEHLGRTCGACCLDDPEDLACVVEAVQEFVAVAAARGLVNEASDAATPRGSDAPDIIGNDEEGPVGIEALLDLHVDQEVKVFLVNGLVLSGGRLRRASKVKNLWFVSQGGSNMYFESFSVTGVDVPHKTAGER